MAAFGHVYDSQILIILVQFLDPILDLIHTSDWPYFRLQSNTPHLNEPYPNCLDQVQLVLSLNDYSSISSDQSIWSLLIQFFNLIDARPIDSNSWVPSLSQPCGCVPYDRGAWLELLQNGQMVTQSFCPIDSSYRRFHPINLCWESSMSRMVFASSW